MEYLEYHKTANIRRNLIGNKTVDHSDVALIRYNYIFILDSTHGFNGLGKDSCKMKREPFDFLDVMRLIWR